MYDRLESVYRALTITRAGCEGEKGLKCTECPLMPECCVALALIDVDVLRQAKLVDVGQATGELLIADTMLRDMDWEGLARAHPGLVAGQMRGAIRWRVTNALSHLGHAAKETP